MSDFLISSLPVYYRLETTETLIPLVRAGSSINLVGLPAVGKWTYFNFFIKNSAYFLNDSAKRHFIPISLRLCLNQPDLTKWLQNEILTFTYLHPDFPNSANQLINLSSQHEVILLLRDYETLPQDKQNQLCHLFLTLRQSPYHFRLVFFSHHPLENLSTPPKTNSRLFGSTVAYHPNSLRDFYLELREHEIFHRLNFNDSEKQQLFTLTGGHSGLLKSVITAEAAFRAQADSSLTAEKLLQIPQVKSRCVEILAAKSDHPSHQLDSSIFNLFLTQSKA